MEEKQSLLDVLKTIFKWKKAIMYTCLIAGVGSLIISFILPVYYQSSTTFLVTSPDQTKPELLFGEGGEMEYYGDSDDIDRILTIGESEQLATFMIDSFDLYNHYDIDTDNIKAEYYVRLALAKRMDLEKTSKDAIILSVEDKDRERSTRMVKTAREKINNIAQELILGNQRKAITIYQKDVEQKQLLLQTIADSLSAIRGRYGIYNVQAQTEGLAGALEKAQSELVNNESKLATMKNMTGARWRDSIAMLNVKVVGGKDKVIFLKEKLSQFNNGMSEVLKLEVQHKELGEALSDAMKKLEQYNAVSQSNTPAIVVVEEAKIPVIKSKPLRKIIVLATVVIAFIFSIIGVLVLEFFKDVNWRDIYNAK